MTYKYTFQKYEPEKMAKAVGTDLPISIKHSVEVCNAIRGKTISQAIRILTEAIELKKAIPYRRFTDGVGHKTKIGAGRYTPKTCKNILNILNSAISNAEDKAIDRENLVVLHVNAHRASIPLHHGRRRREMKRAHIEIVVGELENVNNLKSKEENKKEIIKKEVQTPKQQIQLQKQKPKGSEKEQEKVKSKEKPKEETDNKKETKKEIKEQSEISKSKIESKEKLQ